jgi:hypothetical protein
MDITVSVSLWLIVSLCLASMVIGMLLGGGRSGGRPR